jgi:hypothetical protein
LLAVLLAVGCTPAQSLQPLYTSRDVVTDDWLEGAWEQSDESDVLWIFRSDGDQGYRLTITDDKSTSVFRVRLVRLNGVLFLDATPHQQELSEVFGVPTHMIGRIWIERDDIRIRLLSDDWVTERARQGQLGLGFAVASGSSERVVLTAPTDQLQQFAVMNAENTDAFGLEQKLRRWK